MKIFNKKIFKNFKYFNVFGVKIVITKYVYTFVIGKLNFYYTPLTCQFHKGI